MRTFDVLQLLGDDNRNTLPIVSTRTHILPSAASALDYNRVTASNKVEMKPLVKFFWEYQYYLGRLMCRHQHTALVAYCVNSVDTSGCSKTTSMVRIRNTDTTHKLLLKRFYGQVVTMEFATNLEPTLAVLDNSRTLHVIKVVPAATDTDTLRVEPLLVLRLRDIDSEWSDHCLCWCPWNPNSQTVLQMMHHGHIGFALPYDPSLLLAVSCGKRVVVLDVASASQLFKTHSSDQLLSCDQPTSESDTDQTSSNYYGSNPRITFDELHRLLSTRRQTHVCFDWSEEHDGTITALILSPDASYLASGSLGGKVRVFSLLSDDGRCDGQLVAAHVFSPHDGSPIYGLIFINVPSQGSIGSSWTFLLTGSQYNRELRLWASSDWSNLQTLKFCTPDHTSTDTEDPATALSCSSSPTRMTSIVMEFDWTHSLLVATDITRRVLYVLALTPVKASPYANFFRDRSSVSPNLRFTSISEFLLTTPCILFALGTCEKRTLMRSAEHMSNSHAGHSCVDLIKLEIHSIHTWYLFHGTIFFEIPHWTQADHTGELPFLVVSVMEPASASSVNTSVADSFAKLSDIAQITPPLSTSGAPFQSQDMNIPHIEEETRCDKPFDNIFFLNPGASHYGNGHFDYEYLKPTRPSDFAPTRPPNLQSHGFTDTTDVLSNPGETSNMVTSLSLLPLIYTSGETCVRDSRVAVPNEKFVGVPFSNTTLQIHPLPVESIEDDTLNPALLQSSLPNIFDSYPVLDQPAQPDCSVIDDVQIPVAEIADVTVPSVPFTCADGVSGESGEECERSNINTADLLIDLFLDSTPPTCYKLPLLDAPLKLLSAEVIQPCQSRTDINWSTVSLYSSSHSSIGGRPGDSCKVSTGFVPCEQQPQEQEWNPTAMETVTNILTRLLNESIKRSTQMEIVMSDARKTREQLHSLSQLHLEMTKQMIMLCGRGQFVDPKIRDLSVDSLPDEKAADDRSTLLSPQPISHTVIATGLQQTSPAGPIKEEMMLAEWGKQMLLQLRTQQGDFARRFTHLENAVNKLSTIVNEMNESHKRTHSRAICSRSVESRLEQFPKMTADLIRPIVRSELQNSFMTNVSRIIEPLQKALTNTVQDTLCSFPSALSENVSRTFREKNFFSQFSRGLSSLLSAELSRAYSDSLHRVFVPALERNLNRLFDELSVIFHAGTDQYLEEIHKRLQTILSSSSLSAHLVEEIKDAVISCLTNYTRNSISTPVDPTVPETSVCLVTGGTRDPTTGADGCNPRSQTQSKLVRTTASLGSSWTINKGTVEKAPSSFTPNTAHPPGESFTPKSPTALTKKEEFARLSGQAHTLIQSGQLLEALQLALVSTNEALVLDVCNDIDPGRLFGSGKPPIAQNILLSLIHQLSCGDFNAQMELKLRYLQEAVMSLNRQDLMTIEHGPRIVSLLSRRLDAFLDGSSTGASDDLSPTRLSQIIKLRVTIRNTFDITAMNRQLTNC